MPPSGSPRNPVDVVEELAIWPVMSNDARWAVGRLLEYTRRLEARLKMGMYTGLRALVVVKPEWRAAIERLHQVSWPDRWRQVQAEHPELPSVAGWVNFGRADFIPFGALAYMPDDFSDAEDGEQFSEFDAATGRWRFCCSLKNYESEIRYFVGNVLRQIVESVEYCESLYEEWPREGQYGCNDWREYTTKWLTDAS